VCGISTQLHQAVAGFDETITSGDADFANTGLVRASLIRLGFLQAVPLRRTWAVSGPFRLTPTAGCSPTLRGT
jgi:mRNA interferase MazF